MNNEKNIKNSKNKGFTLVELAIVIVIIGLLVGGVVAGQELIKQSQLQNLVKTVEGYKSAALTYKAKFDALPGDDMRAYNWFGSLCDSTPSNCNGDSDGVIVSNNTPFDNEALRFWQHLVLSKIISGNFIGSTSGGWPDVLQGRVLPKLGFKDVYLMVLQGTFATFPGFAYNNYMIVGRKIGAGSFPQFPFLSPEDAYNIDTKMDDGKPWSGSIFIWPSWWTTPNPPNCINGTDYNITYNGIDCHLNFGW